VPDDQTTSAPRTPEQLAAALAALLQPDPDVLALALFGSAHSPGAGQDAWSDLDALVVTRDAAREHFHPALGWLQPLGEIYCYDQSSGGHTAVTRACFTDRPQLDLVITTEGALRQIGRWPGVPFWQGVRLVFCRSAEVEALLSGPFPPPKPSLPTPEEMDHLGNQFWFKGMLAVHKVVRNDLLIALHLALDMVRDCCLLGMILRDRALGTNVHRHGGMGNDTVAQLQAAGRPYTAEGILDMVEQSAIAFDHLAGQWSADYHEMRGPLLAQVRAAREALGVRNQ